MNPSHFFYHSFPRRRRGEHLVHGLAILESILDRGLLLTPERIELKESLTSGAKSDSAWILQKRICFTELSPTELVQHSEYFGTFSLEFEIADLREMGAIPVFYVPLGASGTEGAAAALLSRLGEAQIIMDRLQALKTLTETSDASETIRIIRKQSNPEQTRCTIGGTADLIQYLEHGLQPIEALASAIRVLFGFFYPVENLEKTEPLYYYRQREWRIVANIILNGVALTQKPSKEEQEALQSLDPSFFGREFDFPTGRDKSASQCQFYKSHQGVEIHHTVRRLIVPEAALLEVQSMLQRKGISLTVATLESLHED